MIGFMVTQAKKEKKVHRLIKKERERPPIGFVKKIETVGSTSQFSDFKKETKEKIEQKMSLYIHHCQHGERGSKSII